MAGMAVGAAVSLDEATLGDRVSHYEIWGCIGQGGMSRVWLARHHLLATPVILKTVLAACESDASGQARVLREAKLMSGICSPRVVRVIDAGMHEHRPYLVEEYVDGVDLAELDRRRRDALGVGLPLRFVCEVMQAACEALHAAHQAGVVHRDLKPSNFFGSPQTGIRLGDFGIAAIAGAGTDPEVSGTIMFMAPEQLDGRRPDPTLDVWGAGATAFDLRYGRAPFSSAEEIVDAGTPPPFPEPVSPAEAYFQQVLRGMLVKDPGQRAPNVFEPMRHFGLLADLLRAESPPPVAVLLDRSTVRVADCVIRFRVGDLALAKSDAIVASANDSMRMRAGLGDALRRAGGDVIEEEALSGGAQPLGSCIATAGGALSVRHVLHAVSAWKEASCVGRATQRALLLADELGHRTLSMAALGTGAARVSMETCASAMMTALRHHLALGGTRLREVEVVLADEPSHAIYRQVGAEALRASFDGDRRDTGLPSSRAEVHPEGATWVDPRGGSRRA